MMRAVLGDWARDARPDRGNPDWTAGADWASMTDDEVEEFIRVHSNPVVEDRLKRIFDLVTPVVADLSHGLDVVARTGIFALHNGQPMQCVTESRAGGWQIFINDGLFDLVRDIAFYVDLTHFGLAGEGGLPDLEFEMELAKRVLLLEGASLRHDGYLWQPVRLRLPEELATFQSLIAECAVVFIVCHEFAHAYCRDLISSGHTTFQWCGQDQTLDPEEFRAMEELFCDTLGLHLLLALAEREDGAGHGVSREVIPFALLCTFLAAQFAESRTHISPPLTHPTPTLRLVNACRNLSAQWQRDVLADIGPLAQELTKLEEPYWRPPTLPLATALGRSSLASLAPVVQGRQEPAMMSLDSLSSLYATDMNFLAYVTCVATDSRTVVDREFLATVAYPVSAHEQYAHNLLQRISCGQKMLWTAVHHGAVPEAVATVLAPSPDTATADWWEKLAGTVPAAAVPVVARVLYGAATGTEPGHLAPPSRRHRIW